jgi:glycosyltransferase involved in cell wall biosynthesis
MEIQNAAVAPLLIVSPSATFRGGADGSLFHLLRRHRQCSRPLIVAFLESGPLVEEASKLGLQVLLFEAGRLRDPFKFVATVIRLRQVIAQLCPYAILSWQTKAHIYASLAGTLARTSAKLVYFQKNNPDSSFLSRLIRALPTTGALACSDFVALRERALTRFPVIAVPSASEFIDLSPGELTQLAAEGAALRATLPLSADSKVVVMAGRLQRWKGFHEFVHAVATLRQDGHNIAGLIVGGQDLHEPGYEQSLRDLIRTLGMRDSIHLAGPQSNIAPWLLAADVLVHASRQEPFGQVILEAMGLGVPVVACRPGGPEEMISHGVDGFLFEYGRQNELVGAIKSLVFEPELMSRYKRQAQESVRRFAPDRFVTRLLSALDSL